MLIIKNIKVVENLKKETGDGLQGWEKTIIKSVFDERPGLQSVILTNAIAPDLLATYAGMRLEFIKKHLQEISEL